nr:MAG: hypothetical protein DIU68_19565 [Chloroflexota bacterium]
MFYRSRRVPAIAACILFIMLLGATAVSADLFLIDYTITCSSITITYEYVGSRTDSPLVEVYNEDTGELLHESYDQFQPSDTITISFPELPEGTAVSVWVVMDERPNDILWIIEPCVPAPVSAVSAASDEAPPCDNLYDGRINRNPALDCAAPVAIYYDSATNRILVYGINPDDGEGQLIAELDLSEYDNTPAPETNEIILVTTHPWYPAPLVISRLSTGEWQLATTYADGKDYIVVWSSPEALYHLAA